MDSVFVGEWVCVCDKVRGNVGDVAEGSSVETAGENTWLRSGYLLWSDHSVISSTDATQLLTFQSPTFPVVKDWNHMICSFWFKPQCLNGNAYRCCFGYVECLDKLCSHSLCIEGMEPWEPTISKVIRPFHSESQPSLLTVYIKSIFKVTHHIACQYFRCTQVVTLIFSWRPRYDMICILYWCCDSYVVVKGQSK